MMTLSESTVVKSSVDIVFEGLLNPQEQLKWNTLYLEVHTEPKGEIKNGTVMTGKFKGSGKAKVYFENIFPNHEFTHYSKLKMFGIIYMGEFRHRYKVEGGHGQTKITQTVFFEPKGIGHLFQATIIKGFKDRLPESFQEFRNYLAFKKNNMSKKVIVFGATGLMGQQIVKENIEAGNRVTVYTRRQPDKTDDVDFVSGELSDINKIKAVIENFDVIISAVGNRDYADPTKIVSPLIALLSKSIKSNQRLIVVLGAGLTLLTENTLMKEIDNDNEQLQNQRADHWEAFCNLLPLDINYLMICPTWVVPGDSDGNYLHRETYFPKSDKVQVSAGNVGHFIASEIAKQKFNKTRIGLVNA